MAGQVCKVYIVRGFKEAGYALSQEELEAKLAQVNAARPECGGRLLVNALARWSSYEIYGFGAEIFPDLESLQKHTAALDELNWFRYIDSESFIGTPSVINEPTYENPIYQLQYIHGPREAGYTMAGEQVNTELQRVIASADELGRVHLLRMHCRWSREDYMMIQIHEWPSLESQMKQAAFEEQVEWPRLVNQSHILGVKAP